MKTRGVKKDFAKLADLDSADLAAASSPEQLQPAEESSEADAGAQCSDYEDDDDALGAQPKKRAAAKTKTTKGKTPARRANAAAPKKRGKRAAEPARRAEVEVALAGLPPGAILELFKLLTLRDLCRVSKLSRAWRKEATKDWHYEHRATPEILDPFPFYRYEPDSAVKEPFPFYGLGPERFAGLVRAFGHRRVAMALSSKRCALCNTATALFSYLAGERQCMTCFKTPAAALCTMSYAKAHWLLTDTQAKALPQLRVQNAKETGVVTRPTDSITVTSLAHAKRSAYERFGSQQAFETELAARKVKAQQSFDAKAAAAREKNPYASVSYPRVLGLERELNFVGANQKVGVVCGPKYGHVMVSQDRGFTQGFLNSALPTMYLQGYETDVPLEEWHVPELLFDVYDSDYSDGMRGDY